MHFNSDSVGISVSSLLLESKANRPLNEAHQMRGDLNNLLLYPYTDCITIFYYTDCGSVGSSANGYNSRGFSFACRSSRDCILSSPFRFGAPRHICCTSSYALSTLHVIVDIRIAGRLLYLHVRLRCISRKCPPPLLDVLSLWGLQAPP